MLAAAVSSSRRQLRTRGGGVLGAGIVTVGRRRGGWRASSRAALARRGRSPAARGSAGSSPAGPGRPSSAQRAARAGARPRRLTPASGTTGRAGRARAGTAGGRGPGGRSSSGGEGGSRRGGTAPRRRPSCTTSRRVGGDDRLEPEQAAVLGALGGAHLGAVERRGQPALRAAPSVPGARACSRGGGTAVARAPRRATGSGSAGSERPMARPTATWARAICSSGGDACSSPSAISE